jgi:hypothetical protein
VPLAVAGVGVVGTAAGTVAGVLITQRRSDAREAVTWTRQREREADGWAREDAARTFEHRRTAYEEFYKSLRAMSLRAYNHGMGLGPEPESEDEGELPEGWQLPTYELLQHVRLYGTATTYRASSEAYSAVWWWGYKTRYGHDNGQFYDGHERADETETVLTEAIRADLAVSDE